MRKYLTGLATATAAGLLDVFRRDKASRLFWLLVGLDALFFALHLGHRGYPEIFGDNFSISRDNGYAEWYQYGKELSIVALCLIIARYRGISSLYAWVPLFLYFLLDDSLAIHETVGAVVSNHLEFSASNGLRAKDFGELVVSGLAALILFPPLVVAAWRAEEQFKWIHASLVVLVGLVAFFGVIVDMVHMMLQWAPSRVRFLVTIIEDGGEMVSMSAIVAFLFGLTAIPAQPRSQT